MKIVKIIAGIILGLILLVVLIIGYNLLTEKRERDEKNKVEINVERSTLCSELYSGEKRIRVRVKSTGQVGTIIPTEFDPNIYERISRPVLIKIYNGSERTVKFIEAHVGVYRKGYSSDLASYDSRFKTDKIISPNENSSYCFEYTLKDPENFKYVDEFEFKIGYRDVYFQK
jgi:hypothetical protein